MHIVTEKAKHFCGDPELLAHRMTCRGVPGCSVALLQGGQVTHSAVSGAAGAAPVTEGTLFECASLTKPLFAVLALQLADEGLLALDESVPARLGGEPWSQDPDFAKITPRHILSHSSGLPDWHSRPMPMLFAPGTAYSYSGQGYYLSAAALGGKNYGTISPGAVCGPCFHALSNAPLRRALDAGGGQRHFSGL